MRTFARVLGVLFEFLKTLQVLPPGTRALAVDEHGRKNTGRVSSRQAHHDGEDSPPLNRIQIPPPQPTFPHTSGRF